MMSATSTSDADGNGNGKKKERKSRKTDILLPSDEFVLQSWKVKTGSAVRVGETLAMACDKISADSTGGSSISASTTTETSAALASASHKRPKRRRRAVPTTNNGIIARPDSQTNSTSLTASLHQRLAEKLAGGKTTLKDASKQSDPQSTSSETVTAATTATTTTTTPTPTTLTTTAATTDASAVNAIGSKSSNSVATTVPILATANGLLRTTKNIFSSALNDDAQKKKLAIGYIEECLHPGFLEGLCVVCGTCVKDDQEYDVASAIPVTNVISDDPTLSQVTVSGGITMTVSYQESREIAQQDSERLLKQRKLSLVLDLDHTLVHATSDHRAQQYHHKDDVRTLRLPMMEGMAMPPPQSVHQHQHMWMQHHVKLRPHIREFLENVQPMYELTVYTAGTRQYAEEITIVLCRHLAGSTRDVDGLERLRYEVHIAELEYAKHNAMPVQKSSSTEENGQQQEEKNEDAEKKRKAGELDNNDNNGETKEDGETETGEPATKKRKKVSFVPPQNSGGPTNNGDDRQVVPSKNMMSDHMTLHNLNELKEELRQAEELEKKAWDLRQKIFGSRVVSRTDVGDLGRDVKSLKRIFPCGGTMAAVVDDREDVWANATDNSDDTIKGEPPNNMLLVRPYHWQPFLGFADINNAAGADLSGTGPDSGNPDVETDEQLMWTGQILKELHKRYYKQDEKNRKIVPEILRQMRKEVLRGSTLVLSGLVPLHKKNIGANAPRPPIVRYAESLGAKLTEQVHPGVTHLVAAKDGTDKALAARKIPGCVLVKPSWLVECFWSVARRDVKPHLMDPGMADIQINNNHKQQQLSEESKMDNNSSEVSESTDDSEDDDLAASFEDEFMNS